MRAIVVRQPWASLIAHGLKVVETRPFQPRTTLAPGDDLAIVAGASTSTLRDLGMLLGTPGADRTVALAVHEGLTSVGLVLDTEGLPLGAVVAVVRYDEALPITDEIHRPGRHIWLLRPDYPMICEPVTKGQLRSMSGVEEESPLGDFTPGRYGWMLSNPRRLTTPVPVKGRQGVFTLPDDVAAKVNEQVTP